jgi:hypothetical protein
MLWRSRRGAQQIPACGLVGGRDLHELIAPGSHEPNLTASPADHELVSYFNMLLTSQLRLILELLGVCTVIFSSSVSHLSQLSLRNGL